MSLLSCQESDKGAEQREAVIQERAVEHAALPFCVKVGLGPIHFVKYFVWRNALKYRKAFF